MMTKTEKNDIFLISMRIMPNSRIGQLIKLILCFLILLHTALVVLSLSSCNSKKEEIPVIPPVTSPLSGGYIGYGVITSSFTHVLSDPSDNSESLGYLRRGSLVKILRRQLINTSDGFISWVYVDDSEQDSAGTSPAHSGWLKEEVMEIYSSQGQARTAAETILK